MVAELERISFAPSIIEGAGQSWNESSGKNALFRSNAEFDEFRKVLVDGKELDAANYTVYAGSTAVELKAEYLKTLSAGEHTLSIVSQNGRADTVFTVVRTSGGNSPKTGNTQSPAPWLALLFISGGLATGVSAVRKRKRHSVSKYFDLRRADTFVAARQSVKLKILCGGNAAFFVFRRQLRLNRCIDNYF